MNHQIRQNALAIGGVAVLAILAVVYLATIFRGILPQWQARTALLAQLPSDASPDDAVLQAATAVFLTESEAAQVLDALYAAAPASGVAVQTLQVQPQPEAPKGLYDVRVFRLQVSGSAPQLLDYVTRLSNTAVSGVLLQNLNIGGSGPLTVDVALYTSPYAAGSAVAEAIEPPVPAPTPTPVNTPTPDLNALHARLDEAWIVQDWGTAIAVINELRTITPDDADLRDKLYAAHVNFGYWLAERGDKDGARIQFERAIAVDALSGEAQAGLASLSDAPQATAVFPQPQIDTYTVLAGDTLYAISRRFGVSVAALRAANGLSSDALKVGQVLTIP